MAILNRVRKFVPTVGGNDKLSENEQIVAYVKAVSVYQKQVQLRKFLGMDPEQLVKQMMEDKGSNEIKTILKDCVVKFDNLSLADEEGNLIPASMADVWDMGEFELCMELFNNILSSSQLKKEEEKNSELPSGTATT